MVTVSAKDIVKENKLRLLTWMNPFKMTKVTSMGAGYMQSPTVTVWGDISAGTSFYIRCNSKGYNYQHGEGTKTDATFEEIQKVLLDEVFVLEGSVVKYLGTKRNPVGTLRLDKVYSKIDFGACKELREVQMLVEGADIDLSSLDYVEHILFKGVPKSYKGPKAVGEVWFYDSAGNYFTPQLLQEDSLKTFLAIASADAKVSKVNRKDYVSRDEVDARKDKKAEVKWGFSVLGRQFPNWYSTEQAVIDEVFRAKKELGSRMQYDHLKMLKLEINQGGTAVQYEYSFPKDLFDDLNA